MGSPFIARGVVFDFFFLMIFFAFLYKIQAIYIKLGVLVHFYTVSHMAVSDLKKQNPDFLGVFAYFGILFA